MRKIFYWADGTWCDRCDLPYMNHKSDDFGTFEVGYEVDEDAIDNMVKHLNRAERNI